MLNYGIDNDIQVRIDDCPAVSEEVQLSNFFYRGPRAEGLVSPPAQRTEKTRQPRKTSRKAPRPTRSTRRSPSPMGSKPLAHRPRSVQSGPSRNRTPSLPRLFPSSSPRRLRLMAVASGTVQTGISIRPRLATSPLPARLMAMASRPVQIGIRIRPRLAANPPPARLLLVPPRETRRSLRLMSRILSPLKSTLLKLAPAASTAWLRATTFLYPILRR